MCQLLLLQKSAPWTHQHFQLKRQSSAIYVTNQQYASAMPAKPTFAQIVLVDIELSSNHCLMTLYHSKAKRSSYCYRSASSIQVRDVGFTVNNVERQFVYCVSLKHTKATMLYNLPKLMNLEKKSLKIKQKKMQLTSILNTRKKTIVLELRLSQLLPFLRIMIF